MGNIAKCTVVAVDSRVDKDNYQVLGNKSQI